MSPARRIHGPAETAARALPFDRASKRRAVAVTLGRMVDERGSGEVAIRELAKRCRRHRMEIVVVLDRLIEQGHVELIRRGDRNRHERSVYRITPITHTEKESKTMTTKAKINTTDTVPPEAEIGSRPLVPNWQKPGFWPDPAQLEHVPWKALAEVRVRHDDLAGDLAEAREKGDHEAEQTTLLALCDCLIEGTDEIARSIEGAERTLKEAVDSAYPGMPRHGETIPAARRDEHFAKVREIRSWYDGEQQILRSVLMKINADTFEDERSTELLPGHVAEARRLKAAIAA